ncbi:MAG: dTDP-4-dehydrorhamnose reductase [Thaumarchaeota archaeon]|nr:dTDP-4-dehydrorhamnose reductase [Nitrososphaerota archaeon]
MKFLVTGSAGLVGSQLVKDLSQSSNQVYSCYNDTKPEYGIQTLLDLQNPESITKTIEKTRPDVIIHLAAMTNVDLCEANQELALKINAKSTGMIAKESAKHRAFLLYVSTDYVFDGEHGMKKENDETNPVDYYGKSKLEGEKALDGMASAWCIARTSTPFGLHKTRKSFPLFVAENLKAKKQLTIVTDQLTSPTYVPNLSRMLIEISMRQITGIIHTAGATRISRYDVASLVAEKLHLDQGLIKPVTIKEMNWTAKRPKDSSLDVSKATQILNEKPMELEPALDLFLNELK